MVAEEQGVAARIIASTDDLEQIAADDRADVPALQGWRRQLFGEQALALKRGELALSMSRARRRRGRARPRVARSPPSSYFSTTTSCRAARRAPRTGAAGCRGARRADRQAPPAGQARRVRRAPNLGPRQDALHRAGDEIGDAERGGERPRAFAIAERRELAEPGAELLVRQAGVAVVDGERQVGAAGMVDADEGGVGDDVQALLAAIVGMRAPADIGEQAGRRAKPLLLVGLLEAERRPSPRPSTGSAPRHAPASASGACSARTPPKAAGRPSAPWRRALRKAGLRAARAPRSRRSSACRLAAPRPARPRRTAAAPGAAWTRPRCPEPDRADRGSAPSGNRRARPGPSGIRA